LPFFGDLVEWLVVPSVGMKCGFLEAPANATATYQVHARPVVI